MVPREEFDHAMAIGVANRVRGIDNDRPRLLRRLKAVSTGPRSHIANMLA